MITSPPHHKKQKSDYLFFGHKKISNFSMKYKTAESDYIFLLHLSVQVFFFYKIQQHNFFSEKNPYIVASSLHYLNGHSPSGSLDTHIYFISNPRVYHIHVHVCVRNSRISYAVNYKCTINKVTCINH